MLANPLQPTGEFHVAIKFVTMHDSIALAIGGFVNEIPTNVDTFQLPRTTPGIPRHGCRERRVASRYRERAMRRISRKTSW
jgi:hypothetical protein